VREGLEDWKKDPPSLAVIFFIFVQVEIVKVFNWMPSIKPPVESE